MALIWPNGSTTIPRVTSEFNPNRLHPKKGYVTPHNGIDLAGPKGRPQDWTTIVSPVAGRVTRKEFQSGGAGNWVEIRENSTGDRFRFFHLKHASPLTFGEQVSVGTVIGVMGETGSATAVHLHYETRPGGGAPVNPRTYHAGRQSGAGADLEGDDDMPSADEVAQAIMAYGVPREGGQTGGTSLASTLAWLDANIVALHAAINAVPANVLDSPVERAGDESLTSLRSIAAWSDANIVATNELIKAIATAPVDLDAVAEKLRVVLGNDIADTLADRLKD